MRRLIYGLHIALQSSFISFSDEYCLPQRKLIFVKTHKTASSTIHVREFFAWNVLNSCLEQGIYMRYALKNNLTIGFPSTSN